MKRIYPWMLVLALLVPALGYSTDKFWVTIGADGEDTVNPVLLFQMDVNGSITMGPVIVAKRTEVEAVTATNERCTAMAYDPSGNIIVWMGNDSDLNIYRAIMDKNTLARLSLKKVLSANIDVNNLQSTQPTPRLLAFDRPQGVLKATVVDPTGLLTSTNWRIHPRFDTKGRYHPTGLAPDGRMSIVIDEETGPYVLAIQALKPDGKPTGNPVVLARDTEIYDVDVTNVLPSGRRFVVYTQELGSGTGRRLLQVIDGTTGQKIGTPKTIFDQVGPGEGDQSMAIDPEGRFVIFDVNGGGIGCPNTGNDPLYFLPLNPNTGDTAGPAKQLTSCSFVADTEGIPASTSTDGSFGLDLLKVQ